MAELQDKKLYEVINPNTRRRDVWSGERINAYQVNNKITVKLAPPKRTAKPKTKTK